MIDTVSKTFFLEDMDDPVAINMFSNSSLYELFNDENISDNLETDEDIYGDDIDEEEFFDDIMQDTSTSQIDIDVDEDIKALLKAKSEKSGIPYEYLLGTFLRENTKDGTMWFGETWVKSCVNKWNEGNHTDLLNHLLIYLLI